MTASGRSQHPSPSTTPRTAHNRTTDRVRTTSHRVPDTLRRLRPASHSLRWDTDTVESAGERLRPDGLAPTQADLRREHRMVGRTPWSSGGQRARVVDARWRNAARVTRMFSSSSVEVECEQERRNESAILRSKREENSTILRGLVGCGTCSAL